MRNERNQRRTLDRVTPGVMTFSLNASSMIAHAVSINLRYHSSLAGTICATTSIGSMGSTTNLATQSGPSAAATA